MVCVKYEGTRIVCGRLVCGRPTGLAPAHLGNDPLAVRSAPVVCSAAVAYEQRRECAHPSVGFIVDHAISTSPD